MGMDSRLPIFRKITQVLSLIFCVGLFVLGFNEFQSVRPLLINHNYSLPNPWLFKTLLAVVLILGLFFGNFFCGWFCAFGTVNDFLYFVSQKLFKLRWRINPTWDARLKYLKYLILGLFIILAWNFHWAIAERSNPRSVFPGIIADFQGQLVPILSGMVLAAILIGSLFVERFFCRYLCPLGALLTPFSKVSLTKIAKPDANCQSCRCCDTACPMGIDLSQLETVNSGECIRCLKCVTACPSKNVKLNSSLGHFNPLTYIAVVSTVFCLINIAQTLQFSNPAANDLHILRPSGPAASPIKKGNPIQPAPTSGVLPPVFTATATESPLAESPFSAEDTAPAGQPSPVPADSGQTQTPIYRDGVYHGMATGFRPGLQVAVTVLHGQITAIEILENREDAPFLNRAVQSIVPEIIATQTLTVNVVSGATYSSRGVREAVADALTKAQL